VKEQGAFIKLFLLLLFMLILTVSCEIRKATVLCAFSEIRNIFQIS